MILYNSVEDIANNFLAKQKEPLTQEEQKEFSTLQNTLIEIETEYKDKIEKFFFVSKTADFSSIKFDKLNKVFLDKFQKLREQTKSEKNLQYLELCIKANFAIKDTLQNELNNFLYSPFSPYFLKLFKNNPLDNAIYSHLRFKQEIQKRNLTQTEAIAELKKLLAEKLKAEFEADFLEKCSCYQNNITNNLLKIIGVSTNSKTNKIEEKGNRLYVSTEIKKGEIFKLSIDKDKEITPAMFKYYIYFLTIATQHIKPIYNNGNMQAMQFIIINLDEVSEELGIRKDKLKKIFKDMLEAFQTVNIEKATYFANGLKVVSKGKRYITINNAKIINGFKIYKNKIEVCLNEAFTVSLINSQEMIIPLLLFKVNQNQYSLSFIIGYFLLLHERRTQKGRNYNDFIYLDIETILNNSCKDIDNIIKQKHSTRDKGLFINNIQHLVNIGLLKEYKYKQNGVLYESNYIENNATFTQWRKYTLAYKFTDKIINECLKPYNKPIPKKSKITK